MVYSEENLHTCIMKKHWALFKKWTQYSALLSFKIKCGK